MTVQRDVLFQVIDALEALEIPYMIVGSFASNYWGRPRTTHDADLVVEIPADKAHDLAQLLSKEFYAPDFVIAEAIQRGDHFNALHEEHPFKIDFWIRKETAYDREQFMRRQRGTMFERLVWVSSSEDTILSKLVWFKSAPVLDRQLQDALEVLEIQEPDLDQGYLDRWASVLGVEDLLADIRARAAGYQDARAG